MIIPASDLCGAAPNSTRLRLARVSAVINPLAHSVALNDADGLAEIVAEFGLRLAVTCSEPPDLEAAVRAALEAEPDLVVVLAGDGTVREAIRGCGPDGPPLAILPGGTMNILSHALYGERPWRETLKLVLEAGVERALSGGAVSRRPFYTAAILGSPALWAPVREAVRVADMATAWRRGRSALSRAFAGHLRFESDHQQPCKTTGLGLICPVVSRALHESQPALEAAQLNQRDVTEVFRLGIHHLFGDWRSDPKVVTTLCRRGRVRGRRRIPAILDGESFLLERSLEIAFIPKAYQVLTPPPAP